MTTVTWSEASAPGGQRFAFADEGEGPLVVLLHGFPDTPHGWEPAARALAGAGYRAVRPWLRGYHPATHVPGRPFDAATLGEDVIALLDALGERQAVVVGHDWGASMAYDAASLHPERVRAIVPVGIPHPSLFPRSPLLLLVARHFIALRMPWAPAATRRNDFAYLDRLYRRWSPQWSGPERDACLARAKECFADPASLDGALDHYRALSPKRPPPLDRPPGVRGLVVGGSGEPGRGRLFRATAEALAPGSRALVIEGAGHWPHRESEARFLTELLAFLSELDAPA